eukprot:g8152.t1
MADGEEAPYDGSSAAAPPAGAASAAPAVAVGGGRGRGRGRGRGGGGVAIEGIAELDASMGRGAPIPPAAGRGKPLPKKDQKDFRGPAGLFQKGDWNCTVCGNINWERRTTCNKCQNPKPNLATDEAREGLGGGFNERQDRASVATVEVDEDGYDDFGRKKIKARADKKAKEDAALARLRKSFGGGMLGGTSLAPTAVPGQFDDASPSPSVTTYDEFGRPKRAGAPSRSGGGGDGGGSGGGENDAGTGIGGTVTAVGEGEEEEGEETEIGEGAEEAGAEAGAERGVAGTIRTGREEGAVAVAPGAAIAAADELLP